MSDLLRLVEVLVRPDGTPLDSAIQLATGGRREARDGIMIGLGWHVREGPAESRVIYHNGETLGFYSTLAAVPEYQIGVAVLANSRDPSPGHIGYHLLESLLDARTANDQ
jgi:CubicO group peptidase (beta-lactamase class C family)